ncbi:cysteine/glutathione ABC transporter ATP-binding protein/permease CydC [Shewanella intestini]|uniref:Cysteine/glutathione ABC transporter ATP-binding protein/permease CydC n=1 Tax=Shewanella intestini TaxID=2017544 RepID=A0ABS5I542_9GAMM|nr:MULTISPECIES: cysteine/glutathione ABC transporter ATP-binding protein/permease CydC [Shewanella]MBR9729143.1 cysteine/glutathione ABC transporter ATP-binding protein/permease CydC [Shewanella intestini]MRG37286.1 cysteine/glutathione ABC transporter ATP-binding protein/permease CydC [Shewanella sp. XMDDZSB0408]
MKVLLPFLRLFSRQWLMMSVGLLLTFITLLTGIGLLSLSGWFLSASAVAGLTVASSQAFNYFTPAGGVRGFSIFRTASRYGERLATHEATFKLLTDLRVWAWRKLLPLSAKNLQAMRQGDMLNRLVADIDTLDHLYLRLLTPMTASLLMIGGLYVFIAWFDLALANVLCGALLAVWLIVPVIFYQLGRNPGEAIIQSRQHYRVKLLDMLQGQAELTLFNANGRYRAQLEQAQKHLFASQAKMAAITGMSQAMVIFANGCIVTLILYLAGQGVGEYVPPGPMMAMVVFAAMASIEMLMPIAGAFQHLSSTVLAAKRVTDITEQTPAITFPETDNKELTITPKNTRLQLDNIGFSYLDNSPVLSGLSLQVNAGDKVAILGKTGCGKSSLLSLITREWQPQQGRIELAGKDISQYSEPALRSAMTVVSQRIYLFSATLRDNLVLALPFNKADKRKAHDARLIDVLQQVGLEALLQGDKPLDAWIGDGGRQLSGGEQRRIGVARALLRDAPLLLLDEPTEGLDKRTERDIMAILLKFAEQKTLLMITHRLTAIESMDKVYHMEKGQLHDWQPTPVN